MPWEPGDREIESVLALPAPERYAYFVKHVADEERLWALGDESGFAATAGDDGREAMPVWPHPRYALACAEGEWAGREPEPIALAEWLDGYLADLAEAGRAVAVFPDPGGAGVVREPGELGDDLRAEAARYE